MESKPSQKALTASDLLAVLARPTTRRKAGVPTAVRDAYLRAASVLTAIREPHALKPNFSPKQGAAVRENAIDALQEDLMEAPGRRFDGHVMLTPQARRAGLAMLQDPKQIKAALSANPAERKSELQAHFESYLLGKAKALDKQTLKELELTLQVAHWAQGLVPTVPTAQEVSRRMELGQLLRPFEELAGDNVFHGRRKEMEELRAYVGVVPPESLLRRLGSRLMQWARPPERPALSVYGPGGVGKSALIARFMLEHTRVREDCKIPFAYLDFDRAGLDISEPLTLCVEMLRQVCLQFPHESFANIRAYGDKLIAQRADEARDLAGNVSDGGTRAFFADVLGILETTVGPRPFIVVLDSFEEVQYRGERRALPFWDMLAELQRRWPFLRVVISGRAPVTNLRLAGAAPQELELGGLDAESATAILVRDGVSDKALARRLVEQVGAVPLSLKLAAELVRRELVESTGVKDLRNKSSFWISASAAVIQGQLYARILGHIHNEQVRRLAHPGLVLRRVTPQVILHVLNEPCELGIGTLSEARELFEELGRETSLVKLDDSEGALVHRADLRRVMLDLLREREPSRVTRIHEAAVKWYGAQSDLRSRAESIYHRLCLKRAVPQTELEHPEIRSSIQASIVELPESSQAVLASYGFQVSKDIVEKTSREQRDAAYVSQVEEILPFAASSADREMDDLLNEILPRLDRATPLYRAAARIHLSRRRDKLAEECLEEGLSRAVSEGKPFLVMELLAEKAWAIQLGKDRRDLVPTLDALADYADRHGSLIFKAQERTQRFSALEPNVASGQLLLFQDMARLFGNIGARELWGLVPALRAPIKDLAIHQPECMKRIAELVVSDESPFFATYQDWDSRVQKALETLTNAAWMVGRGDERAISKDIPDAILGLCEVWPYRILHVRPAYVRGREGKLSEAAV